MNIVWKFWFKHNKCWANLASSKNVNLRILVASSFSGECEKCRKGAREKERERKRDRWDTLSVFTIGSRRLPGDHCMYPRVLFFSWVLSPWISSPLHVVLRWTFLVPFFLAYLHSFFQKIEVSKIDCANSKSLIIWFLFNRIQKFMQKKRACRW